MDRAKLPLDNLSSDQRRAILNAPIQLSSSIVASSLARIREGRRPDSSSSQSVVLKANSDVQSTEVPRHAATVVTSELSTLQRLRDALSKNSMSPEANKRRRLDSDAVTCASNVDHTSSVMPPPLLLSTKNPQFTTKVAKPHESTVKEVTNGVKREPSPSPADLRPRQITEGSKLYTPLPANLRRTHYNYAENRKEWLEAEKMKMKKAGLSVRRAFFREDGISLDWVSKVGPVMSDTLLPAPVAKGGGGDKEIRAASARPPPGSSPTTTPPAANASKTSTASQRPPQPSLSSQPNPTFQNTDFGTEHVQEFLKRYFQTFDKDRASLASAYARMGTLSCQIHRPPSLRMSNPSIVSLFSTLECGRKEGRLDVLSTLVSINSSFKFIPTSRGVDFAVDSVWLGPSCGIYFIKCYAQLVSGRDKVSVDMNFALRDKDEDEEDRVTEGLWSPLVVVAHQMTFRDLDTFF